MLDKKLPVMLEREPLVEAVCEIRMQPGVALSDILPGILFHELTPKPVITRLPAANIPSPMRAQDPSLHYAATQRLDVDGYVIAIGDRNIIISCGRRPYPKWSGFKEKILYIVGLVSGMEIAPEVERFSLKYVNIIQSSTLSEQISKIDMDLRIGSLEVNNENINLTITNIQESVAHILTIATGAEGAVPGGRMVRGVLVGIDSICDIKPVPFNEFSNSWESELEKLHNVNKDRFFNCLKQQTIEEMGPTYG
ncbi:TIGR04255 family protein [Acetobacter ascendens]|uniref:TIGR04255 family protein n=1 Tax=Acetobacter ascendens TaxID=481146 RepID=UPI0012FF7868|nr:TIGR04255 family protein [Acetobacter ascendens]